MNLNKPNIFEYQSPATLNQAAPDFQWETTEGRIQNTWYTILDTTKNARIYSLSVNVEDANETLEVRITIDGETIQANAKAATHSTNYKAIVEPDAINRVDQITLGNTNTELYGSLLCEGKSIKIEIRKTTAAGAGNITAIAIYGVIT